MERKLTLGIVVGLVASVILVGCDGRPSPPKDMSGRRVKVVGVLPADAQEFEAVTQLETARVNYKYRLEVLQSYYRNTGNSDKYVWACNELKNLDGVATFRWEGLVKIDPPVGEVLAGADERRLVEETIAARNAFAKSQDDLIALYDRSAHPFRAKLIRNMKDRLDPIRIYMYFLDAEIPPANLKPSAVISAAEGLYGKARRLHRQGKRVPLMPDRNKLRRALLMFQELIRDYPRSDKIALSAYYVGDIYKEYFGENVRAVHWYERAWQWDATVTEPARFQAAVVWDYRLRHRDKAMALYRQVIQHEQFNRSNVDFSIKRIEEIEKSMSK